MDYGSVSSIIIRNIDNKIFIAKRSKNKEFSPELWETVGGHIEENENPEQALKREIKEELNCEIEILEFFKTYHFNNRFFKTFIVKFKSKPIPNKEDFDDFGWFDEEEINKLDFAIDCKERIIEYFSSK
ncbi:MAG: NUDIX domain-containing protein [Patescibacteria group bacterium]|nr:NUDIX domain-containing protein [Patescibacteria group bacterium]MDD4304241.1 NUDIX domain-containing protein [Patescibacteria group bacterium]MDD4695295.1 NUDIX domain-containing protein [Patescibacteria group bacterium]